MICKRLPLLAASVLILSAFGCGDDDTDLNTRTDVTVGERTPAAIVENETPARPVVVPTPNVARAPTVPGDDRLTADQLDDQRINTETMASSTQPAQQITLDELQNRIQNRNGKPLFLNFWATWCEPCTKEMPVILDLHKQYGQNQVDFLAVSADTFSDTVDQVQSKIQELNMTQIPTMILMAQDQEQAISAIDEQWEGQIPATFIYDAQGNKVTALFGEQTREEFENALKSVVSGTPGQTQQGQAQPGQPGQAQPGQAQPQSQAQPR